MCGLVTTVAPLGTVKRKSDDSDVFRRDITIADQRCVPQGLQVRKRGANRAAGALAWRCSCACFEACDAVK